MTAEILIESDDTFLRLLTPDDLLEIQNQILDWGDTWEEKNPWIGPVKILENPECLEGRLKWVDSRHTNEHKTFGIYLKKDEKLIGAMALKEINPEDGFAFTATIITKLGMRLNGYAKRSKIALLEYAFLELGLRNVYSRIAKGNKISKKYNKACGYTVLMEIKNKRYYPNVNGFETEVIMVVENPNNSK